ncbi:MAG: hypothetical protein KAW47_02655, partial [Thermoplasmatales archaeon]|nr:hypothetical protein [Thermoplasmatales archaeon]
TKNGISSALEKGILIILSFHLEKIIDFAAKKGKVIELNANPHRLDLDWRYCKYAKSRGVKIAINPDAHNISGR